jgi:hypothetical protein
MKIAFVLGKFSTASRPLDFNDINGSSRGLTGSELGIICTADEMVKLGHEVVLFTCLTANPQPDEYCKIKIRHVDQFSIDPSYDAVVSWNEPDYLRYVPPGVLRICSQMLNDWPYCQPGFEDYTDIFTCPSQRHLEHVAPQTKAPQKFMVIQLGCDPSWYTYDSKIPGRVIWASSADRGLHMLLQEWHKIKAAAPHAHLKIFYNFAFGDFINYEDANNPSTDELAQRVRYMLNMINRLKPLGVELVGSVSRDRINKEMSEAEVLAFSCDTRTFTEGFSIATLEGCAAKACPIISDVDALGQIYGGIVPMVKSPVRQNIQDYTNLVIRALTDENFRNETNKNVFQFAKDRTWKIVTGQLEEVIIANRNK